jgi:hypothetical protein
MMPERAEIFTVHGRRGTKRSQTKEIVVRTAGPGFCDRKRDPAAGCSAWNVGDLGRREGDDAGAAGAPRRPARDGTLRSRDRIAMAPVAAFLRFLLPSSSSPAAERGTVSHSLFSGEPGAPILPPPPLAIIQTGRPIKVRFFGFSNSLSLAFSGTSPPLHRL